MAKRWIALGTALLLLICTSCRRPQGQEDPAQGGGAAPLDQSLPIETPPIPGVPPEEPPQPEPEEPPEVGLLWSTDPVLTQEEMPGDYNGLELPVQGATGYTTIQLPLWEQTEDSEAARLAVEAWEAKKALEAEQAQEGAAGAGAELPAGSGADRPAEPVPPPVDQGPNGFLPARGEELGGGLQLGQPGDGSSSQEPAASEDGALPPEGGGPAPGEEQPTEPAEPALTDGALALLPPGTPFTILEEKGGWWRVLCEAELLPKEEASQDGSAPRDAAGPQATAEQQATTGAQPAAEPQSGGGGQEGQPELAEVVGWVEHRYCMVNLPDVIPSILYDPTNSYASQFISCGKPLEGVTGEALYPGVAMNPRLGEEEAVMPVLYSMAFRLCAAQRAALEQGNCLVLYEGFRPLEAQVKVARTLSALMRRDDEVERAVNTPPWNIYWFIATGAANHQQGYAVDVSVARVNGVERRETGDYAYIRVTDYECYEMPTPIHELSRAAAAFTGPVNMNSATAWKSAQPAPAMDEPALGLQSYCAGAGLTPLASEWWHFNDLAAMNSVLDNLGTGDFLTDVCLSAEPPSELPASAPQA